MIISLCTVKPVRGSPSGAGGGGAGHLEPAGGGGGRVRRGDTWRAPGGRRAPRRRSAGAPVTIISPSTSGSRAFNSALCVRLNMRRKP
eukprot:1180502-Prorocentrum_minimum.AAC.7